MSDNAVEKDLFAPLDSWEEVGGYLFAIMDGYKNKDFELEYVLSRFLNVSRQIGGVAKAIACLEADEGFSHPNYLPPEDWEDIKKSLHSHTCRKG